MYYLRLIIYMICIFIHYNIFTLYASPVYSYGGRCLGLYFLFVWFFLSERLDGVSPPHDIMDLFSFTSYHPPSIFTLYASPVYSYGRPMPRSLLFIRLVSSLREIGFMMFDRILFYNVREIAL